MKEYFSKITETKSWLIETNKLLDENTFTDEFVNNFHTTWTVSGHRIREQLNDDTKLEKLLRHVMPKYNGKKVLLYRGENQERWKNNQIGFCWTTSKEKACMFGRGLNSIPSGGLLLSCNCKANWIIAGPSDHSKYLAESEYTVEPSLLKNISVLSQYDEIYK